MSPLRIGDGDGDGDGDSDGEVRAPRRVLFIVHVLSLGVRVSATFQCLDVSLWSSWLLLLGY